MRLGIAEILESIGKMKKNEDKITALKKNDSLPFRIILQSVFDPAVSWALPTGNPPYKPNELVDQQNVLIRDARKIVYFIKGFHPNLTQVKREAMFIEMLETVDPKDAALLCAIKEKKLPFKGITMMHVVEAYPGLIPNG
jgi:hypothetical protein